MIAEFVLNKGYGDRKYDNNRNRGGNFRGAPYNNRGGNFKGASYNNRGGRTD